MAIGWHDPLYLIAHNLFSKANTLSEPQTGFVWTSDTQPPDGAKLESHDGYALLRYTRTGHADRCEILGLLVGPDRQILGVALTQQDAANRNPNAPRAILDPDGSVSWGSQEWPNYEAWLLEMDQHQKHSLGRS